MYLIKLAQSMLYVAVWIGFINAFYSLLSCAKYLFQATRLQHYTLQFYLPLCRRAAIRLPSSCAATCHTECFLQRILIWGGEEFCSRSLLTRCIVGVSSYTAPIVSPIHQGRCSTQHTPSRGNVHNRGKIARWLEYLIITCTAAATRGGYIINIQSSSPSLLTIYPELFILLPRKYWSYLIFISMYTHHNTRRSRLLPTAHLASALAA